MSARVICGGGGLMSRERKSPLTNLPSLLALTTERLITATSTAIALLDTSLALCKYYS